MPSLDECRAVVRTKLSMIEKRAPKKMCLLSGLICIALFTAVKALSTAFVDVSHRGHFGMRRQLHVLRGGILLLGVSLS
jgi:hypothetical protein